MPRLVELLHSPARSGFPADYLLARLPNRRAARIASCPAGRGEESRRELERELDWFHRQLEPGLRKELAPVLLFFELPALLAALRCSEAGDRAGARSSLAASRLSRALRELLERDIPFPEKLQALGKNLAGFAPDLEGLAKIRADHGRDGLERVLVEGIMAAGRREQPTGPVRDFLDRLADRRDLLRLAKAERWQREISPAHPPRRLRRLRQILAEIHPEGEADPARLDRRLLAGMTREINQRRRSGGRLEQLLDYLWTCYLAARACGIQHLRELLGEERVRAEMIL